MRTPIFSVAAALAVAIGAWLGPAPLAGQSPDFVVIVNASNAMTAIGREQLASIFLKRQTRWSDGGVIMPIDQAERSEVRERFSRSVLGRSAMAIRAFWQQQVFSGRDVPPVEKSDDRQVMEAVANAAGGIGYVRSDTRLLPGVRALNVVEQ